MKRAWSNWPDGPRKLGSSVIRRTTSASEMPSRRLRARWSRAASCIHWPSTCWSSPKARAWSGVIGRRNWRPSACTRSVNSVRNCSMEISALPTDATEPRLKPRKMSPMPQIAKLMTRKPTTAAMTVLPSQPEEALRKPRSMSGSFVAWVGRSLAGSNGADRRIIKIAAADRNTLN